jgi:lysophospholipase L1-like esterase
MGLRQNHVDTNEGGRLRPLILAAWTAPVLFPVLSAAVELAATGRLEPRRLLALAAGLVWIVLFTRASWRGLLLELTGLVLRRTGFVPPALFALVAAAVGFGGGRGPFAAGLALGLILLAIAAGIWSRTADRRRFRGQSALIVLYLVLFLLLDLFIGAFVLPSRSHNNLFAVHDPQLGWKLRPGLEVERKNRLFTSLEEINGEGFRGTALPEEKPAGTRRIVCLGDSHSEAYTVNNDETYTSLLAGLLSPGGPVEVLNFGVGGYSTDQELLAYVHHGRRRRPDLVLLQFCSNDVPFNVLHRYWRGHKPCFERHGSTLLLTNVPVPDNSDAGLAGGPLLSRSSTLLFVESLLRQVALGHAVETEVDMEEAWAVTRLLLRDLDAMVREDGARFAVFNADQENREADLRLRQVLAELDIPYLATSTAYAGDFGGYWVADHWNREGHRAIARTLAPEVARLLPVVVSTAQVRSGEHGS